ncbi:MAG: hypothetical protein V4654_03180 [Bdellovibrionota bacterium]
MSFFTVLLLSLFLCLPLHAQSAPTPKKNSVEDIFIWKVSDELKLSAFDEKKFADIHRDLNKQKLQLATQLQKLSFQSKENPQLPQSQASNIIKDYKKTLIAYNNLSLQELDKMKALLGDKKFLDYLAIKQDINLKLKSLVLGEDSKAKPAKLPPPQIIEEK